MAAALCPFLGSLRCILYDLLIWERQPGASVRLRVSIIFPNSCCPQAFYTHPETSPHLWSSLTARVTILLGAAMCQALGVHQRGSQTASVCVCVRVCVCACVTSPVVNWFTRGPSPTVTSLPKIVFRITGCWSQSSSCPERLGNLSEPHFEVETWGSFVQSHGRNCGQSWSGRSVLWLLARLPQVLLFLLRLQEECSSSPGASGAAVPPPVLDARWHQHALEQKGSCLASIWKRLNPQCGRPGVLAERSPLLRSSWGLPAWGATPDHSSISFIQGTHPRCLGDQFAGYLEEFTPVWLIFFGGLSVQNGKFCWVIFPTILLSSEPGSLRFLFFQDIVAVQQGWLMPLRMQGSVEGDPGHPAQIAHLQLREYMNHFGGGLLCCRGWLK